MHDNQKETCLQKMGPLPGKLAILDFWAFQMGVSAPLLGLKNKKQFTITLESIKKPSK